MSVEACPTADQIREFLLGRNLDDSGDDQTIRIFDIATTELDSTHLEHLSFVRTVGFLPRQNLLVSASEDRTVKGFAWPSMELLFTHTLTERPTRLAPSEGSGEVVVGTSEAGLFLVPAAAEGEARRLNEARHIGFELGLCVSDTGEVCSADATGLITVLLASTGEQLSSLQVSDRQIISLALSPDDQTVVAGTSDGSIVRWNWRVAESVERWQAHTTAISAITFSKKGDRIASACRNGELRIWNRNDHGLQSSTQVRAIGGINHLFAGEGKALELVIVGIDEEYPRGMSLRRDLRRAASARLGTVGIRDKPNRLVYRAIAIERGLFSIRSAADVNSVARINQAGRFTDRLDP